MNYISSYQNRRSVAHFISNDRRRRLLFMLSAGATAVLLAGCTIQGASQDRPIAVEKQRIQLPQSGELEVQAHAMPPVGDVLPVEVSIKNLVQRSRMLGKPAVRGITDSGERLSQLGLDDPTVVNNTKELLRVVSGGQSAMGAALSEEPGTGWVVAAGPIAWVGLAISSAVVGVSSPSKRLAIYQLSGPIPGVFGPLPAAPMPPGSVEAPQHCTDIGFCALEISGRIPGYVFLPNRKYAAIEVTVINTLTGNEEVLTVPWNNTPDVAEQHREGSLR